MKLFLFVLVLTFLQFGPLSVVASEETGEVLARRGNGVVTQDEFAARADRIPAQARFTTLRNGGRLRDVINNMLLRAQLAADAREAGFDQQPVVIDRMQLAAEAELGDAWLQHYVDMQPEADYEALAQEYFLLHGDDLRSEEKINVSHILVSTEERPEADARALVDSIWSQLSEEPARFDELVLQYSEDPSASANKGKFTGVKRGEMVGAFEDAAFALNEGEISVPVKTAYGFHIIRLDAHILPKPVAFEEVKAQLMENERKKHQDRIRQSYLSNLTAMDVDMSEEALREMVRRQFGDDMLVPEVETEKTE